MKLWLKDILFGSTIMICGLLIIPMPFSIVVPERFGGFIIGIGFVHVIMGLYELRIFG